MSLQKTKNSCALCHAYLFEEDDVVYCPVCGAPHHRECYNSIGDCALHETHGTENQYDLLKAKEKMQENKKAVTEAAENSTQNGDAYTPGDEIFRGLPPLDFLGGVPADAVIEDGVTAKEARNFVISNTARYIPKFMRLSKDRKASFNFMSFFFPCEWMLSRKMYKFGIITGVLLIISTLLTFPLQSALYNLGFSSLETVSEIFEFAADNVYKINYAILIAAFLGEIFNFTIRIVVGILGDWWYKKHTISKIKDIKQNSDDIAEDFRKQGGVNIFLFMLGVLVLQYLPSLIFTFL